MKHTVMEHEGYEAYCNHCTRNPFTLQHLTCNACGNCVIFTDFIQKMCDI